MCTKHGKHSRLNADNVNKSEQKLLLVKQERIFLKNNNCYMCADKAFILLFAAPFAPKNSSFLAPNCAAAIYSSTGGAN
jgi:hypothetical protein